MKNIDNQQKLQKSIQFPDSMVREIEQLAQENERSFSAEVVYAMRMYVRRQRESKGWETWGESINNEQVS